MSRAVIHRSDRERVPLQRLVERIEAGRSFGGASEKIDQRLAVVLGADGLFRHLGAGGVMRGPDLEQFRHCFFGPDDVELL